MLVAFRFKYINEVQTVNSHFSQLSTNLFSCVCVYIRNKVFEQISPVYAVPSDNIGNSRCNLR